MSTITSIYLGLAEKASSDPRKMPKVEGIPNKPYENKQADVFDQKAMNPSYAGDIYKTKGAFVDKIS
ncbi:hypothetical protein CH352_08310 [Leptospira hartskeerlii]|uniref:Uncharacterized protein n=2 Tax=Leptospira TaxID=171 RepID=A0A2N0A132_9LEPT|nr:MULTISPECIES: hypothetical protein [Leptospira]PJZ27093.1 hypothetical protein CH357_00575 [Leptospira hartskeerlii]PJZ33752.1 hypothetical protein CH352_08310 [Leptospira hartskeerlii]PJZ78020.1 hypothetical protein CH365_06255 [Leptospira neocaledonica]